MSEMRLNQQELESYLWAAAFTDAEQAAIDYLMTSGRPLAAEILMTKPQIWALFKYVSESDRPLRQNMNSMRLIIQGCNRIGKLHLARKELEMEQPGKEPDWVAAALEEVEKDKLPVETRQLEREAC
jgi:hypothetical protein